MLDDPDDIRDRQIVVRGVAELVQNDVVICTSQRVSCPTVVINTELTNTTLDAFTGYVKSAEELFNKARYGLVSTYEQIENLYSLLTQVGSQLARMPASWSTP